MKVYAVLEEVDYEGNTLLGVYANRDDAQEKCDQYNEENLSCVVTYSVSEEEVL